MRDLSRAVGLPSMVRCLVMSLVSLRLIGVMATTAQNRWKAILGMSSDHAGIDRELVRLRAEMYRVLAQLENPRRVRAYLVELGCASRNWFAVSERVNGEK